jgi:hypothetical protein
MNVPLDACVEACDDCADGTHSVLGKRKVMAKDTRTVSIDLKQYRAINEYCDAFGVSIEDAVHEALSDFIECSIEARLHTP